MLGYDRVLLYNRKTRGFCEGPLLEIEMEGGYEIRPHLNIGTYIENEFKDEEEVIHIAVEHQKKLEDVKKELKEVEYQLKNKYKELEDLNNYIEESEEYLKDEKYDWRYE